ncbi:hypothetical protein NGM33_28775 [Nocardiopsis dassonvillei]|uniref:hypothetical protein n=1 Tax=Nocardiopsis dassonvillei TaxID=2014 RepID=UPI0020A55C76|nr:hypothetical protein [Nocardiopsis dassonvillei]MCP3017332.1 hypothetical protein [Nocardiopsis dassonvillei]
MEVDEGPRVCVVVTCPTAPGATPEETAAAIAHAVRRVAPGADIYHHTPEED